MEVAGTCSMLQVVLTVVYNRGSDMTPTVSDSVRQSDSPTASDTAHGPSLSKTLRQLRHSSDRCPTYI